MENLNDDGVPAPLVEVRPEIGEKYKSVVLGITICPPQVKNYTNLLSHMQVKRLKDIWRTALGAVHHDIPWKYKQVYEYHKNGIVHSHLKLTCLIEPKHSTVGLMKDLYKAISYSIMKQNKCKCVIDENKHWFEKYNRIRAPQVCIQQYLTKEEEEEWDKYLLKDQSNGLN